MKKAFSILELFIVVAVLGILLAIGIPAVTHHRQTITQALREQEIRAQQRTFPELSQEEKDRLQREGETASRERANERAEILRKQTEADARENEQSLLNRIQQEEQTEYQIQQEYINQLQPLSFILSNWQLNRKENLKVFVLYDIQNKQEYIIVQNVYHPEFLTITPRIKNEH